MGEYIRWQIAMDLEVLSLDKVTSSDNSSAVVTSITQDSAGEITLVLAGGSADQAWYSWKLPVVGGDLWLGMMRLTYGSGPTNADDDVECVLLISNASDATSIAGVRKGGGYHFDDLTGPDLRVIRNAATTDTVADTAIAASMEIVQGSIGTKFMVFDAVCYGLKSDSTLEQAPPAVTDTTAELTVGDTLYMHLLVGRSSASAGASTLVFTPRGNVVRVVA